MSVLQDYAPKFGRKRREHTADIIDLNDPPPAFLTRQDNGRVAASSLPRALDDAEVDLARLAATIKKEKHVDDDLHLPARRETVFDPLDGVKYLLPSVPLLEMLEFVEGIMAQPCYRGDDPLSVAKAMCTFAKGNAKSEPEVQS